jgi:hypothetical protein
MSQPKNTLAAIPANAGAAMDKRPAMMRRIPRAIDHPPGRESTAVFIVLSFFWGGRQNERRREMRPEWLFDAGRLAKDAWEYDSNTWIFRA